MYFAMLTIYDLMLPSFTFSGLQHITDVANKKYITEHGL